MSLINHSTFPVPDGCRHFKRTSPATVSGLAASPQAATLGRGGRWGRGRRGPSWLPWHPALPPGPALLQAPGTARAACGEALPDSDMQRTHPCLPDQSLHRGPWGEGWMRGHVVAHTRACSHAGTGDPGERGGRVDTCSLTHVLTHTQAAGTRQQGGGTPACERGEAGLGLALRGFLSSAPGTSLGEQLPSPSHSDSMTGPHVTWRLSAPEERGQRGGDRQPCRRPALRAAVSRYLVFNDDTVSQRRTAPGLSGPY